MVWQSHIFIYLSQFFISLLQVRVSLDIEMVLIYRTFELFAPQRHGQITSYMYIVSNQIFIQFQMNFTYINGSFLRVNYDA